MMMLNTKGLFVVGWIPELVSLHHEDSKFDKEKEFDRMFERFHAGHVLITVGKIIESLFHNRILYLIQQHQTCRKKKKNAVV